MRVHSRRLLVGIGTAVALMLAIAGATPIAADTPLTQSGRVGVHYLADSSEFPDATCTYDSQTTIHSIRLRAPFVYARNTVPGVETQAVSWLFVIQSRTPGTSAWSTVATSASQKKATTDVRTAAFTPVTRTFAGSAGKEYRALVVIRWYGANGTTEVGRATHRVDWYAWAGVPRFRGLCPGGVF
jgi:hypothetical protein